MASHSVHNYCLVCSEVILPNTYVHLDQSDAIFLLRILLEIPQDNQLLCQSQLRLTSIPICKLCGVTVKQCKEIYSQISVQIQKFWGFQNEILRKMQKETEAHPGHKSNQYWVELCRHFVKNRNIEAFKYPFVFHDLTKLLNSFSGPPPFVDHFAVRTEYEIESPIETTGIPTGCNLQEEIQLDPLETRNEGNHDEDKQNDISDQCESSDEDENPPQQFYWNPTTRQFHCSLPSCTISSKIKTFIERHFRREHLRALSKPNLNYTCNWPTCGKIFKKKVNHQSHMNKHNGTPSLKCEKCGRLFYYRRGLLSHQTRNNCKSIYEQAITPNNIGQYPRSAPNFPSFVQNVIPKHDFSEIGRLAAQTLRTPPHLPYQINNTELPCTITSNESCTPAENFYENTSFNQTIPFQEIPQFEDEGEDSIPNESDENYELSEDDETSDDDEEDEDKATSSNSKEADDYSDGYICSWPGCGKSLCNKTSLSCHMDRHRGTPKHKCEECDHLFYSVPSLLNHRKKQHANQGKIKNTKRTTNSKKSTNPIPSSSSKETNSPDYKMEEESAEESEDDDETFENMRNEKCAERRTYKKSDFSKNYPQYKFVRNPTTGKFHCLEPSCSKKAVTESYIENHFQVVHLKTKEKQSFACNWPGCGRSFFCKINLQGHLDQHKGTPQWKCDHCPRQCYWRSDLGKHMKRKHGIKISRERGTSAFNIFSKKHKVSLDETTGKYKCPEVTCTKSYKCAQTIINHYAEVHDLKVTSKKKMFVCEYDECNGRRFNTKDHLKGHMDKHRGTPQCKCEQCGKSFYWKAQLNHHVKAQH